ncbi:MAG: prolipoprotein diacylglyceryl transferase [Chloroflexi bacterium]|nr:prolipoprotein diacylglyceryl transferase [Chloroflexota bacterium]
MYPQNLFSIAGIGFNLYIIFYALGVILALPLMFRLARERDIPASNVMPIWIISVAAAGLGGGAISWILGEVFDIVILGISATEWITAVILALAFYLWLLPWARGRVFRYMDVVFPPIALAVVFARIGCFLAGCCYGIPAENSWLAVTFPAGHPTAGIPVHPTQLYEAAGMLVVLALLLVLRKVPAFDGKLVWVFLASYGILRFVVEFYRGHPRPMVGPLSLNQVVCLAFLVIGSLMVLRKSPA